VPDPEGIKELTAAFKAGQVSGVVTWPAVADDLLRRSWSGPAAHRGGRWTPERLEFVWHG
jgi:hypothetical protein